MRRWMSLLVPLLVAGCATWGQGGFDGGRSFDNRSDAAITTANVNQLHEVWKLPGTIPVVGGGHVFDALNPASVVARHALIAYPEAGCTGSGVPTCAQSWSVDGHFSPPATDGNSVFAVDVTANLLRVFGTDGTPAWTYTPAAIAGSTTVVGPDIRIDNGRLWIQVEDTNGGGIRTDRLVSLPAGGCGASTCSAVLTISGSEILGFVATEGAVFATRLTNPGAGTAPVVAYDPVTGAPRWHSSENAIVLSARDGRVYAHLVCESTGCTPGVVYPATAGVNCTGNPKVCSAVASIRTMGRGPLLTAQHAVVVIDGSTSWYSNTCTGTCTSIAHLSVNSIPDPYAYAAAGGLVFSAGAPSLGTWRIYAIDDTLAGCPGGTCTADWTTNTAKPVHALAVTNGRLYAAEDDGFVHVYAR